MSRSGYSDDYGSDYPGQMELYRAAVHKALRGRRGQVFLREMLSILDALPEKALIEGELRVDGVGVCALGAVAVARGMDTEGVDTEDRDTLGKTFGIAPSMAAEIMFINDDDFSYRDESPAERFHRVRAWVAENLTSRCADDAKGKGTNS